MAEFAGRKITIAISPDGIAPYVVIAAVRSKSLNISREAIDVTSDDSNANRTLLDEAASRSIDASVSGVMTDEVLLDKIMTAEASQALEFCQITVDSSYTFTGKFFLNNVTVTGEYQDAATFEASLQSSGVITKAAVV